MRKLRFYIKNVYRVSVKLYIFSKYYYRHLFVAGRLAEHQSFMLDDCHIPPVLIIKILFNYVIAVWPL